MSTRLGAVAREGLWDNNVVFVQMLALCPAMAVTTSGSNGLGMGLATTAVLLVSNVLVSAIRHGEPPGADSRGAEVAAVSSSRCLHSPR